MARKSKPKTPLQLAYAKERKRIQQFMRRAEKRGYQFAPNALPDKPKRITKQSVERLRKLTPGQLYKKAEYGGEATYGEVVPATVGRKAERSQAAKRAAETRRIVKQLEHYTPPEPVDYDYSEDYYDYDYYEDTNEPEFEAPDTLNEDVSFYEEVILTMYRNTLQTFNPEAAKKLTNWFNAVIASQGKKATAKMVQDAQEQGVGISRQEAYSETKVTEYIERMMDYLPEAGDFTKQEIIDALEYEESYEEPA